jgi:hypothetical protein
MRISLGGPLPLRRDGGELNVSRCFTPEADRTVGVRIDDDDCSGGST